MGRAAVAAALVGLLGTGCLAPQDIDEVEPQAEERNHAPRIVVDQALVAGMAVPRIHVQNSCPSVAFRVGAIEDLDLDDTLRVRFFVDYDLGCEECRQVRDELVLPADEETRALRTTEFAYELRLPLDEGTHLVEAWVSDGFSPDDADLPVNRAVLEGHGVDSVVWVLVVEEAETQECLPVAF